MTNEEKKLTFCPSCRDNVYNHGLGGATECWCLKSAKIVRRVAVGTWEPPPYTHHPVVKTLSCHHFERGTTWLDPKDSRIVPEPKPRKRKSKKEADNAK